MATTKTNLNTVKRGGVIFQTDKSDLTNAAQFVTTKKTAYQVELFVTAYREQDQSQAGAFWRRAMFRTDSSGVITQVGTTQTPAADLADAAGWIVNIITDASNNIVIQVAGTGSPVYWNIDAILWTIDPFPQT